MAALSFDDDFNCALSFAKVKILSFVVTLVTEFAFVVDFGVVFALIFSLGEGFAAAVSLVEGLGGAFSLLVVGLMRLGALGLRDAGCVAIFAASVTVMASSRKLCRRFKTLEVAARGPRGGSERWYALATLYMLTRASRTRVR